MHVHMYMCIRVCVYVEFSFFFPLVLSGQACLFIFYFASRINFSYPWQILKYLGQYFLITESEADARILG